MQATAAGVAIGLGGALRDGVGPGHRRLAGRGPGQPGTGYSVVYHLEIALLFATLVALGPLVRRPRQAAVGGAPRFGLAEFPG